MPRLIGGRTFGAEHVDAKIANCEAIFDSWPWRRIRIDFGEVRRVLGVTLNLRYDPFRDEG